MEPTVPAPEPRRRTPAEEARTLVAAGALGALSTLTAEGAPWGSFAVYGVLGDGSPVLSFSTMAEHGRNLLADPRASLAVAEDPAGEDPLDAGRVTLAGRVAVPAGEEAAAARASYLAAVPGAAVSIDWDDFTLYVLRVERVRWVGGFARMGSADAAAYREAEPDPVAPVAARACRHMDDDHAGALLDMARALGGVPDATAARCLRADRYGLDLRVTTPRGVQEARVGFAVPCATAGDLRGAAVELTRRARA